MKTKETKVLKKTGNTNYPVGDFLIRFKNASRAGVKEVVITHTKLIKAVADVLKAEGYLESIEVKDGQLTARLTFRNKKALLMDLTLISRPGLRRYVGATELMDIKGPETYIVSTNQGVMASNKARKENLGGELLVKLI